MAKFLDKIKDKETVKADLKAFARQEGTKSIGASLISILVGILVGFLLMLIIAPFLRNANPGRGFLYLLTGPFGSTTAALNQFGTMLFYAVPLIFTGLSVAVAYKTGLFNIGAPGQFLMGTMGSLLIALNINTTGNRVAGVFVWILAVLVGAILGFLWSLIPGALKAFFGINEVIICIMTNWIAANIVTWVFTAQPHLANAPEGKSGYLIKTISTGNYTPNFGSWSYLDISIIFAIIFAILMWIIMNKTALGYSMKACGYNKDAAKYAGINEKLYIMIAMGIAGALAALGGAFYYLNPNIELQFMSVYQSLPDYGFNGIPAALLANCNPIGVIFSAIFIRWLNASGSFLQRAGYNKYFADIIIAAIIYMAGFARFMREQLDRYFKLNDKRGMTFTKYLANKFTNYIHLKKAGEKTETPVSDQKEGGNE